jgi:phosphatidylglycerol---prolipoprotein diacylglyceryl transferase
MFQRMNPEGIIHHPFKYDVGFLSLTGFGLAVLAAFVIAQIIAQRELARRGHDPSPIPDLIFAAVVGGLLGAKLYFAFVVGEPSDFFSRAGFVFWGGLIGGIIAVAGVVRFKRLSIPRIADVAGICIAAAYAVGRTGCWAVGDDYGTVWNSRWAVAFPDGAPPSTAAIMAQEFHATIPPGTAPDAVLSVYPTQIFEVAMGLIMFGVLWRMRDHKHAEGWLFGVYMVMAGAERFIVEFFRAKDDRLLGSFTYAQMIAAAFIIAGVVVMIARKDVTARAAGIYGNRPLPAST